MAGWRWLLAHAIDLIARGTKISMAKRKQTPNLEGLRFGRWVVIKRSPHIPNSHAKWECVCDCGTISCVVGAYLKNGQSKSCGCLKEEIQSARFWQGVGSLSGTYYGRVMRRAIELGQEFSVSKEYLLSLFERQKGFCVLSGLPIYLSRSFANRKSQTASIDRIDSSGGYIVGNVQWVDKRINRMKQDHSDGEFIALCKAVAKHNDNLSQGIHRKAARPRKILRHRNHGFVGALFSEEEDNGDCGSGGQGPSKAAG
jgi:hypothetical protein